MALTVDKLGGVTLAAGEPWIVDFRIQDGDAWQDLAGRRFVLTIFAQATGVPIAVDGAHVVVTPVISSPDDIPTARFTLTPAQTRAASGLDAATRLAFTIDEPGVREWYRAVFRALPSPAEYLTDPSDDAPITQVTATVGQTIAVTVELVGPRGSAADMRDPTAWSRDAAFSLSLPARALSTSNLTATAPVLIHYIGSGQSLENGTLSEVRLRDTQPKPNNILMLELGDLPAGTNSADIQGPWPASHAIVANFLPLVESTPDRVNPDYVNPATGVAGSFAPGNGETWASGFGDGVIDLLTAAGHSLTNFRLCITIAAIGGRPYRELAPGSYSFDILQRAIAAGYKAAQDRGWAYLPMLDWQHGVTDASGNPVYGDQDPVISTNMTPEEYASYVLQFRRHFSQAARQITGLNYEPYMFIHQTAYTFTNGWRRNDGRIANTAEGQLLASHMDPYCVLASQDAPYARTDRLHCFAYAYYNHGYAKAAPFVRTLFGNGRWRLPEPIRGKAYASSPTEAIIPIDRSCGELRFTRYQVTSFEILDGGQNFRVGDEVHTAELETVARWIVTAIDDQGDGYGPATELELKDPGSNPTDFTGTVTCHGFITEATLVDPGTGDPFNGAYADPVGGVTEPGGVPARFTLIVRHGVIAGFVLFQVGRYNVPPDNPVQMITSGMTGVTANLSSTGSGLQIAVKCGSMLCHTTAVPYFLDGAGGAILDGGTGWNEGDVGIAQGGTLLPGGHPATVNISLTEDGAVTFAAIRHGGDYEIPPGPDVTFETANGGGTGLVITCPIGAWPLSDPSNLGIDIEDDTPIQYEGFPEKLGLRPPNIIPEETQIITFENVALSAIKIAVDQPWGRHTRVLFGQRPQGEDGPAAGARVLISGPPALGTKPGQLGQFALPYLARSWVDLPTPDYQAIASPMLSNTRFNVLDDQSPDAAPIPITTAGVWVVARWRAYCAVNGVAQVQRVAGDHQPYAIRLQRVPGQTSTQSIRFNQIVYGTSVAEVIAKALVILARIKAGADSTGTVTPRVFTMPALASFSGQLPPNTTTMFFNSFTPSRNWAPVYLGSDDVASPQVRTVPVGTVALVIGITYTPGTAPNGGAGANDYIDIEEPSLNPGTLLRTFNPLPDVDEQARARKWYWRPTTGLYVPAAPALLQVAHPNPMVRTPTITGYGAGFNLVANNVDGAAYQQTTGAVQQLVFDAR